MPVPRLRFLLPVADRNGSPQVPTDWVDGSWVPYSPRDYGAKGDGVANDTAALQAAIDAAAGEPGGFVLIPRGSTFLCNDGLTLRSNVALHGEGITSVIQSTNAALQNLALGQGVTGVTITGIRFLGPGTNHTDVNTPAGLRFDTGCTDLLIDGCWFEKWDDAILTGDSQRIRITNNQFRQCAGGAWLAQGCTGGVFGGNVWDGDRTGIGDGVSGQSFLSFAESATVPGTFTSRITVTGNTGVKFSADAFFVQGHHCDFTGNDVDTCNNGFTLQAGFNETVSQPVTGGSFNTVTGNVVRAAANNGVVVQPSPGNNFAAHNNTIADNELEGCLIAVVLSKDAFENDITGNVIRNSTSHGIFFSAGGTAARNTIAANQVSGGAASGIITQGTGVGNAIVGNYCYLNHDDGIKVISGTDTLVVDNVCQDNDSATLGNRFGINLTGGTRTVVRGNKCFCSDNTHFQNLGVNVAVAATGTILVDNDCANNRTTTNGLANADTTAYLRGNRRTATGLLAGRAVLVAGTVVVANVEVLAGDSILLSKDVRGGTDSFLQVSAIVANTSFTILSGSGADTGTVFWEIVH